MLSDLFMTDVRNISDFVFAPEKFIEKYGKETDWILSGLRHSRHLSDTHNRVIEDIYKVLDIFYTRKHWWEKKI